MGCKKSKNNKGKEDIKNISKSDEFQLSLLNLQVKVILIYMISTIFLFYGVLQSIKLSCDKGEVGSNPNILLVEGQYLALIASILISYIDFSRYNELNERCKKGEINRSLEPEALIKQASILSVILYELNIIVGVATYKASFVINTFKCDKKHIDRLSLQAACFIMRFYGDYFLLRATLKSINLIRSKYDKRIGKIENPDVDAVIAAEIYVIQRGVLYNISCSELEDLINSGDGLERELLLLPKQILVVANIFGVVANITSLMGFIKLYNRNSNEPIFGR
ncbi:hypothetical protein [Clostridium sp. 1001271B_151109_B4]|uniref:hypothetical protein n=1 Tax=Clostridium sp. 1001271B_151109_B4 TaxID=2787148 RepID=UPI0018AB4F23|nr:hypothetical protein [Clostridium sp. 1001271B_151109_B4]